MAEDIKTIEIKECEDDDDALWDATSQKYDAQLTKLAEQIRADRKAGKTKPFEFDRV